MSYAFFVVGTYLLIGVIYSLLELRAQNATVQTMCEDCLDMFSGFPPFLVKIAVAISFFKHSLAWPRSFYIGLRVAYAKWRFIKTVRQCAKVARENGHHAQADEIEQVLEQIFNS